MSIKLARSIVESSEPTKIEFKRNGYYDGIRRDIVMYCNDKTQLYFTKRSPKDDPDNDEKSKLTYVSNVLQYGELNDTEAVLANSVHRLADALTKKNISLQYAMELIEGYAKDISYENYEKEFANSVLPEEEYKISPSYNLDDNPYDTVYSGSYDSMRDKELDKLPSYSSWCTKILNEYLGSVHENSDKKSSKKSEKVPVAG